MFEIWFFVLCESLINVVLMFVFVRLVREIVGILAVVFLFVMMIWLVVLVMVVGWLLILCFLVLKVVVSRVFVFELGMLGRLKVDMLFVLIVLVRLSVIIWIVLEMVNYFLIFLGFVL